MDLVLACDLGGTNFRAALLDRDGAVVREASRPSGLGAGTEADPEQWWRLLADGAGALLGEEPVRAVAICGATRTQVFLDAAGAVLHPAITWHDSRAGEQAERLRALAPPGWAEAAHLNPYHPVARLAWLAERAPDAFARLAAVVDPKDFLNARLTGRIATDRVSAARMRAAAAPWDAAGGSLLGALGVPPAVAVVPVLEPTAILGPVRPGLPSALGRLAGVPVLAMAHDTWATVVGMGALRPGLAYAISGTTEVFGAIGAAAATAPGLLSVDWGEGARQLGGPSQSGADTLAWLRGVLGGAWPEGGVEALLATPRAAHPALFLPFLQGERVPFWDPSLRGAFLGLDRSHGAADLAWAVLEGVAFLNRTVLERAEAALGAPVAEIRFGGGGAASPAWAQVKADVTGRPVAVGAAAEPGLLGGAIAAWAALGAFDGIGAAQAALARVARRHAPDPARHARYAPLHAAWTEAVAATRAAGATLAALPAP